MPNTVKDTALQRCFHEQIMDEYEEPVIHAKVFANEFHELSKNFRPPLKDSNPRMNLKVAECNDKIIDFLVGVKNSIDRGRCDAGTFKEKVIEMNNLKLMEIELWWYLLKCKVMNHEDFYQIFDSSYCQNITNHLCEFLCRNIFQNSMDSIFRKSMNSDLIELLLHHKERCNLKRIQSSAYNHFLLCSSAHNITENKPDIISIDCIVHLLKMSTVKDSIVKSFLLDMIEVLMQGDSMSMEAVMNENENFIRNEKMFVKKNLQIFQLFDSEEIINCLKEIFVKSSKPKHWQNLFYLLTCIMSYYQDTWKHFKALILFVLEDALQELKKQSLLHVFILARQCSFSQIPNFPSYLNWFSATFSSESSRPINSKEKAIFFMDFLNEMVVFDSLHYLKVHINRAPCLPMDCQSLLSDYVKLVKTKLIDLNESTDLGLFDNVSNKSSAEFDVETVLNIFSKTNEVPQCVLQASLFSKFYYEKKFLVTLLSKYEGKNSVRHKLITKLQSLGKIPNSLLLNYKYLK